MSRLTLGSAIHVAVWTSDKNDSEYQEDLWMAHPNPGTEQTFWDGRGAPQPTRTVHADKHDVTPIDVCRYGFFSHLHAVLVPLVGPPRPIVSPESDGPAITHQDLLPVSGFGDDRQRCAHHARFQRVTPGSCFFRLADTLEKPVLG